MVSKKKWVVLFIGILLVSCNKTKFYADPENKNLSIFSNKGFNIMSCDIGGKPWRTKNRILGGFMTRTNYEFAITKIPSTNIMDTLQFVWYGSFLNNSNTETRITMHLPVDSNFSYKHIASLNNKRINLNGGNGYFVFSDYSNNIYPLTNYVGSGSIYFHTVTLDSTSQYNYSGKMSGLLECDFDSFKIEKGRFDHTLENGLLNL